MNLEELTTVFRNLGAPDPKEWAASQIREGIPQLHAYAFLKEAWAAAIDPDNPVWIENMRSSKGPQAPALERLLALGADPADLTTVVRDMQVDMMFSLCFLLGCPNPIEVNGKALEWRLFVTNENEEPMEPLLGLHESVITTDPQLIK